MSVDSFSKMDEFKKYMEAILADIEQSGNQELLFDVKKFCGLLPNQAIRFVDIPHIGRIDHDIANIIVWLNKHEIETLASCSGTKGDHGKELKGYVSLVNSNNAQIFVKDLESYSDTLDVKIETGKVYFVDSITIRFGSTGLDLLNSICSD